MPDRTIERDDADGEEYDRAWILEGNCPTCDGTGEVCCDCDDCDDRGCRRCIDGERTCESCQGSGFVEDDFYDDY